MSGGQTPKEGAEEERGTQSKRLMALAAGVHLFHTAQGEVYGVFKVCGHREVWLLRSRDFKTWLTGEFFNAEQRAPNAQALADSLNTLEAKARFEGLPEAVYLRVAPVGGKVYIDLGNPSWEVVEVSEDGWSVLAESPIRFRRSASLSALPRPERGGSLEDLRQFVNLGPGEDWKLLAAFLVASLLGKGPFPILVLQGEQGSAKSTSARVIRALVDPSSASLRSTPKDEHNLVIMAKQSWLLSFDNLSGVQPWLSDALCRMSTGSGFTTRALYTDCEEVIFEAQRPIVVNGIDDLAVRDDLKDRTVSLNLPPISAESRRDEEGFWRDFHAAEPRIFGALLDALAGTFRNLPDVDLLTFPRMADFARVGTALEAALDWPRGSFSAAYGDNRNQACQQSIENDPLAGALLDMVPESGSRQFTATDWLKALGEAVGEAARRSQSWPKGPGAFSNRLRRLQPALRSMGVEVRWVKLGHERNRIITVERLGKPSSPSSASSA